MLLFALYNSGARMIGNGVRLSVAYKNIILLSIYIFPGGCGYIYIYVYKMYIYIPSIYIIVCKSVSMVSCVYTAYI